MKNILINYKMINFNEIKIKLIKNKNISKWHSYLTEESKKNYFL